MVRDVIAWAVLGFIAGLVARIFVRTHQPLGCVGTIALGIVGSVVGGTLGRIATTGSSQGLHQGGLVASILGAMLVLWLIRGR